MSKKETTLDDLAVMIKRGFDGVDKKFEQVDKRFDKIEKINHSEHKEINLRLSNLEFLMTETVRRDEFLELKRRMDLLEAKLS